MRTKGESNMTIFLLCVIVVQLVWVVSTLNTIKRQNYIKMQMTIAENDWSEDEADALARKALDLK